MQSTLTKAMMPFKPNPGSMTTRTGHSLILFAISLCASLEARAQEIQLYEFPNFQGRMWSLPAPTQTNFFESYNNRALVSRFGPEISSNISSIRIPDGVDVEIYLSDDWTNDYSGDPKGNWNIEVRSLSIARLPLATPLRHNRTQIRLRTGHNGKCLTVEGSSRSQGAKMTTQDCGGVSEWFGVVTARWGFQQLASHANMCLEIDGSTQNSGGKLIQWDTPESVHEFYCITPYKTSEDFRFVPTTTGRYFIIPNHSKKCLDVYEPDTAAPVRQWACHYGDNQQFFVDFKSPDSTALADTHVLLYEHCNFTGRSWAVPAQRTPVKVGFPLSKLTFLGVPDNTVSSARIPLDGHAMAFDGDQYQGGGVFLFGDYACLASQGINDKLSSLSVARPLNQRFTGTGTIQIQSVYDAKCIGLPIHQTGQIFATIPCTSSAQTQLNFIQKYPYSPFHALYQQGPTRSYCLDVKDASTADGARLQAWGSNQYDCGYSHWNGPFDNQQFVFEYVSEGVFLIRPKHSNKCLDVDLYPAYPPEPQLLQWGCGGSSNQLFRVLGLP